MLESGPRRAPSRRGRDSLWLPAVGTEPDILYQPYRGRTHRGKRADSGRPEGQCGLGNEDRTPDSRLGDTNGVGTHEWTHTEAHHEGTQARHEDTEGRHGDVQALHENTVGRREDTEGRHEDKQVRHEDMQVASILDSRVWVPGARQLPVCKKDPPTHISGEEIGCRPEAGPGDIDHSAAGHEKDIASPLSEETGGGHAEAEISIGDAAAAPPDENRRDDEKEPALYPSWNADDSRRFCGPVRFYAYYIQPRRACF